ncbi:MAG: hypothetical protein QNJ98_07780 [Planctomycetota bacterium]|nr:hypothetical protein [Planctomycetota bacterium]
MQLNRILIAIGLLSVAVGCQTTPLDNIWPGCVNCEPTPAVQPQGRIPWEVRIDERVSPASDCNPVRTQHTLVATVYDQCGAPLPGQRVEWILNRFPTAVGDIVAHDDQYGQGAIAPLTNVYVGNNGNKIDNQYAISFTNFGNELLDAGNNYPYTGANGARLPDITVGPGQSWLTITSSREGVTDITVYVPGIRDGTKHKIWAKKVWADYQVEFPENATNTLPNNTHPFPVRVTRTNGDPLPDQVVEAEILDGPSASIGGSGQMSEVRTDSNGVANFTLTNQSGESGTNRVRFTVKGRFFDELCPKSAIVSKTWRRVQLNIDCSFAGGPVPVGKVAQKTITVTNTGDAPAEGVMVEDMPGAGLRLVEGTFPMTLGTLAPGETRTITAGFTADAEGRYENRVRVRDGGSGSAESSCPVEFVKGKLEITKICEPTRASRGSEVRFVVTVRNTGRGPLENVVVVDQYPEGITPTSKNSATIGTLPAGESREVIFTGTADQVGAFTNFARATADGHPEQEATCTLTVVECRLEMELIGPDKIYYGEEANFTLKVVNVGDGDAEGCTVRVTYGGCLGGGYQDFNIGPLAPGEDWVTDFSKTATAVGPCMIEADSNCGAKCAIKREAELKVTGLTALQLEMTDKALDGTEEGVFRTGETFIYRLRVENDVGTEATPPLQLMWELPPELEFITGKCLNGQVDVTGSAQQAASTEFTMGVGGYLDFEIQVRVLSAPDSNLVKAEAIVTRVSDGVRLAEETESTTLKR